MIGRRPEPVPGVEPGRWRVLRARGLSEPMLAWWYVDREGCYGSMCFHTCLLYTSPSPRDGLLSRMPSSA